jgi:predicted CoA-binding protein
MPLKADRDIATLLQDARTVAMVGASNRADRASNGVMRFLQMHGFRVIPVNPAHEGEDINGVITVASLSDIAEPIDIVDIFRNPEDAGIAVDEAIAAKAGAVWLQLGVINEAAAARAEAAGMKVVMDRCPKIEYARLGL